MQEIQNKQKEAVNQGLRVSVSTLARKLVSLFVVCCLLSTGLLSPVHAALMMDGASWDFYESASDLKFKDDAGEDAFEIKADNSIQIDPQGTGPILKNVGGNLSVFEDDGTTAGEVTAAQFNGAVVGNVTGQASTVASIADHNLEGLGDVTFTSLADGEFLKRVSGAWKNVTLSANDITADTFADARIAASNVTQHEAALTIDHSQVTDFDTQVRTSRLDQMAAPTSSVDFNNQSILNAKIDAALVDSGTLADAQISSSSVTQHLGSYATLSYVDAVTQSLDIKDSVRVTTTGSNITLSGTQTIDGIALVAGDRVLVKDQSTPSENGIYDVDSGSWARSSDADDSGSEVNSGMFTFVEEGVANANAGFVLVTANPISVGSSSLQFAQFSGAGQITAGVGLSKTGNTLDANIATTSAVGVASFNSNDFAVSGGGEVTINEAGIDESALDIEDFNTAFPDGAIPFASGNNLSSDSSNLFWDNSSKELGIGTNTPSETLEVAGVGYFSGGVRSSQFGSPLTDNFTYDSDTILHYGATIYNDSNFTGGNTLGLSGYAGVNFFEAGALRMSLDNGELGIGTATPSEKLDIETGHIFLDYNYGLKLGTDDNFIRAEAAGGEALKIGYAGSSTVLIDTDNNSTGSRFAIAKDNSSVASATELFRVQEDGNVGIGTDNPSALLDVDGSAEINGNLDMQNNGVIDIDWTASDDGSGSGLDADLLDGVQLSEIVPYHSGSDFADGTLVTTNIPATATNGASFVIEISGKSYTGGTAPFKVIAQGYLYNDTIINYSGMSYGGDFSSYIKIFENGGFLSFWWPRITYWNSFNVHVRDAGGNHKNTVTSITNSTEPTGTKKVQVNLHRSWHSHNDGVGSTLDADLLDGQEGSYYLDAPSESTVEGYIGNDVTANYVPRSNGSKLVTGTISDDGSKVEITTTGTDGALIIGSDTNDNYEGIQFKNNATDAGYIAQQGSAATADLYIGAGDTLNFRTGSSSIVSGTDRMTIDSDGDVGIGTTSPSHQLHVYENTASSTTTLNIQNESTSVSGARLLLGTGPSNDRGGGLVYTSSDNLMRLYNDGHPSSQMSFDVRGSSGGGFEAMRIDSDGDVGIGITTPSYRLHAYHATNNIPMMLESGDANSYFAVKDDAGTVLFGNEGNKAVIANSSGTTQVLVAETDTGDVGIGVTSPDAKLEIAGQIKITGGSPGADKVLTSDANGLATWEDVNAGETNPAGTIITSANTTAPTGYFDCDGAAKSRTTYADLFAEIDTIYGEGDGSTTFNLPKTDRWRAEFDQARGYRYYKILFDSKSSSGGILTIREIYFRWDEDWKGNSSGNIGGISTTITESSYNLSFRAGDKAFDGNIDPQTTNTAWETASNFSGTAPYDGNEWVQVDFGSGNAPAIDAFKVLTNTGHPADKLRFEASDDGTNWTSFGTFINYQEEGEKVYKVSPLLSCYIKY